MLVANHITGYKWVDWSVDKGLPPRALHVGHENDGTPIYVGRTWYKNNLAPVKMVPSREIALISDGRKEVGVKNFEVSPKINFKGLI